MDQREVDPVAEQRRYHMSNRIMSLVFGLPGLAMFIVASGILVAAGIPMMDSRNGNAYTTLFMFGIMGFLVGLGMLWAAVILWRYDSKLQAVQAKTKAPSKRLSL